MSIESTIVHPDEHLPFGASGTYTNGHTFSVNPRAAAVLPKPPSTHWRRIRLTYEWADGALLWVAGSHWAGLAVNLTKHDGSGTYKHLNGNAGAVLEIAGVSIGMMTVEGHLMDSQPADGGWWQFYIHGYYTTDTGQNPNAMGGEYWGFQGRVATGGGDFSLSSYSGQASRASMRGKYDWPVA